MRRSVVALVFGELVLLAGLALAWLPAAPIALGGQLVAWSLLRDSEDGS